MCGFFKPRLLLVGALLQGSWVAHNDDATGTCSGFFHTGTGEWRADRPPESQRPEFWQRMEGTGVYLNKLTGEKSSQLPFIVES
jgi:hypothetical protein